jgi:hypothetical protein
MFRTWPWWITLLLLALSLGWFWLLSENLSFTRVEPEKAPATAQGK